MVNNSKKKVHKQSKYFTIMLVPHSSGKTRSLRIPLMAFYMVTGIATACALCFTSFVIATTHFKREAESAHVNLEQSAELNSQLTRETRQLNDLLANEKEDAQKATDQQREEYEEIIQSYETYYKEKADELEQKLDDLDKAREEIYNMLSSREYLPEIAPVSAAGGAQAVFMSLSAPISETEADIAARYNVLDKEVDARLLSFGRLAGEMEKIKPYLDNYPTAVPSPGQITSEHSGRANPFGGGGGEFHFGIDIGCGRGTSVRATGGGYVTKSEWDDGGFGYVVEISHGFGLVTRYAHNSVLEVSVGDHVARGDLIARSGSTGRSTGPHVHYEVIKNGVSVNPRGFIE